MLPKSKVKYIQSLSHKKVRDEEGVFVAEGPKIVNELLGNPSITALEIFSTEQWIANVSSKMPVTEIDPSQLGRISFHTSPNQVLGIFKKPALLPLELAGQISLFADNIQDPGNIGTIVRCADWFGIKHLVCSEDSVDIFGPKAIQSSMGSVARVSVHYLNLEEVLKSHPSVNVYAATLDGTDLHYVKHFSQGVILIGNESKGISDELLKLASHRITIGRVGGAESLNAGVATGIILSQLVKAPSPSHSHS